MSEIFYQLKEKLQRIMAKKEQLEREYRELAEFAQCGAEGGVKR